MRADIDRLMADRNLDAIMVAGKVLGNPPLLYMLKGVHITQALVIKRRGAVPVVVVGPMDRASTVGLGYEIRLTTEFRYGELLREHDGDPLAASVAYFARIFEDLGVIGRLGCYGYRDMGYAYAFLSALDAALPSVHVIGEVRESVIEAARATKDPEEVSRIREVGVRTAAVVCQTLSFLQAHDVAEDETLRRGDGGILTVGDVHTQIAKLVSQEGLEDPEGFIFSTGRDAGIPHSRGRLDAPMRLGEPIVFDIFPREVGGGYFFDLTRTFCLGYAPAPVRHLHVEVVACLRELTQAIRPDEEARHYQRAACDFFANRGHPTIAEDPATQKGYVHGIGHGVGLDIHEAPRFYDDPGNGTRLSPGHLFAVEPGLYYPDEDMGCRVEDMLWIDGNGAVHNLTEMPYDLVVPMGGSGLGRGHE